MKKSVLIAAALAAVLFVYGYCLTELGHDHEHHEQGAHSEEAHNPMH